ncbi:Zn-dependent protease with chaperone function [Desulfitobacterium dichloroeliminans LMG P-21439]|uniref:Zn-dependent protease with chaperone function n=1 Tax=Desulfitobacterium dichloroeliminans (strain LMG P-21439 / DCA1) TaxID=871963 RepID=L0F961_DESDL|nr:M48 family metallopeptidase [Desulfitobacterium dichloroeliminans]AGA69483.1 Zn-dependent protease with chaperone function [Desulfitobacterium dichloroeliminans LMG P-21439]
MKTRSTMIWMPLMSFALLFSLLYLWYVLFPGPIRPEAIQLFGLDQVQQGQDYSKGTRMSYILSFMVQALFLIGFLASGRASSLSQWCEQRNQNNPWRGYIVFYLIIWVILALIRLPFAFFSSFYWQHLWEFSTQSLGSWGVDYLKQSLLDIALGGVGVILLFLAFHTWPRIWWIICGVFFSLWLVMQSILWPILIAPMFNHFQPIEDPIITEMVYELADKANLEIKEIQVMDASRRTTKANAYFAGVGGTKRIVLYDNLLNQYSLAEIKAVIAHEMAHWQKGHIAKGLTLGILGSFLVWGGAYLILRAYISKYHVPPLIWAVLLLFVLLTNFVSAPLQNSISRQMEIEADQSAVLLTGDPSAAIHLQTNLALKNRSDLSPPRFVEWLSYTHPSVLTRIEKIREVTE